MALPSSRNDREYKKFVQRSDGQTAVAVDIESADQGGGGGAGGGDNTYYAKPSGTNADATVAYTSATTITVTGLPFTFTENDIALIEQVPTSGLTTKYKDKADFSVSSGVITVAGASFATTDKFIVTFTGSPRTENTPTKSTQTTRLNPDWEHRSPSVLADVTNGTDGTYSYYYDMKSYLKSGIALTLSGGSGTVTVTIWGTKQDDGTAADSCTYQDIGTAIFGSASWTADAMLDDTSGATGLYKHIKVKVVANTSGSDDADWKIEAIRNY